MDYIININGLPSSSLLGSGRSGNQGSGTLTAVQCFCPTVGPRLLNGFSSFFEKFRERRDWFNLSSSLSMDFVEVGRNFDRTYILQVFIQ